MDRTRGVNLNLLVRPNKSFLCGVIVRWRNVGCGLTMDERERWHILIEVVKKTDEIERGGYREWLGLRGT